MPKNSFAQKETKDDWSVCLYTNHTPIKSIFKPCDQHEEYHVRGNIPSNKRVLFLTKKIRRLQADSYLYIKRRFSGGKLGVLVIPC